ncbi:MAG TPA: LysR family transcriptional regulator [Longimicrobiales bacterium]|nr:LysR family transcriptional regulator [Longimicrobiales bacterium]
MNFGHLRYFWVVAREGTVTRAAEVLNVTQPTVSTQVQRLEESLGRSLFRRLGNRLELTDDGRMVQRFAAEIFALAEDLEGALESRSAEVTTRFSVGIVDSLPLLSAHRLLQPSLGAHTEALRVNLRTGKRDRLIAALASRTLDVVLSDSPSAPTDPVRVRNRLLTESRVSLFGTPELTERYANDFPHGLDEAPFLVHTANTPLRRGLDAWFARTGVHPRITGEVENVGLLQLLGRSGMGLFVAPTLVEQEIVQSYGVSVLGQLDGVLERFYGLTLEGAQETPHVSRLMNAWS